METTINKIQVNWSTKTDSLGNVIENSMLLNIRTNDVIEAVQLYNQLGLMLKNQEKIITKPEPKMLTARDIFPDEEEEACPECGNKLIQRKSRDGNFFMGCRSYPNCRYTRKS